MVERQGRRVNLGPVEATFVDPCLWQTVAVGPTLVRRT
ncbi:Hypothetical protein CAP_1587 [Chondromyces apiculatus DSM 436]|uniref:Uncharacterized protein n=1 Tax=Chondromyces apiculatus DSM 436 TaxID=1192034 RepID=A0A017TDK1_9BACT|nr:Hypothetical protein CAP_1587 [Chondromyces apiculatus DSM 436]